MKRTLLLVMAVAALFFLADCDTDSAFTIEVTGTPGLEFSGSYMVVTADGRSTSRSVDGTVPESYSVTGAIVSVMFQNQAADGTLRAEILREGELVAGEETTAAYGVVSIATD